MLKMIFQEKDNLIIMVPYTLFYKIFQLKFVSLLTELNTNPVYIYEKLDTKYSSSRQNILNRKLLMKALLFRRVIFYKLLFLPRTTNHFLVSSINIPNYYILIIVAILKDNKMYFSYQNTLVFFPKQLISLSNQYIIVVIILVQSQ